MTILCTQNTFKIDPKKQRQGPKKEKLISPSNTHESYLYKIITWQLLIRARNLVFLPTPTWIQLHLAHVHVPASHNIKCFIIINSTKIIIMTHLF